MDRTLRDYLKSSFEGAEDLCVEHSSHEGENALAYSFFSWEHGAGQLKLPELMELIPNFPQEYLDVRPDEKERFQCLANEVGKDIRIGYVRSNKYQGCFWVDREVFYPN